MNIVCERFFSVLCYLLIIVVAIAFSFPGLSLFTIEEYGIMNNKYRRQNIYKFFGMEMDMIFGKKLVVYKL